MNDTKKDKLKKVGLGILAFIMIFLLLPFSVIIQELREHKKDFKEDMKIIESAKVIDNEEDFDTFYNSDFIKEDEIVFIKINDYENFDVKIGGLSNGEDVYYVNLYHNTLMYTVLSIVDTTIQDDDVFGKTINESDYEEVDFNPSFLMAIRRIEDGEKRIETSIFEKWHKNLNSLSETSSGNTILSVNLGSLEDVKDDFEEYHSKEIKSQTMQVTALLSSSILIALFLLFTTFKNKNKKDNTN